MKDLDAVIRKFPEHELVLNRHYPSDYEFRVLCEDYELAANTVRRWKDDRTRAEQYQQLAGELEDEILEFIEGRHPSQIGKNFGN
jgi:hypothetical protein